MEVERFLLYLKLVLLARNFEDVERKNYIPLKIWTWYDSSKHEDNAHLSTIGCVFNGDARGSSLGLPRVRPHLTHTLLTPRDLLRLPSWTPRNLHRTFLYSTAPIGVTLKFLERSLEILFFHRFSIPMDSPFEETPTNIAFIIFPFSLLVAYIYRVL